MKNKKIFLLYLYLFAFVSLSTSQSNGDNYSIQVLNNKESWKINSSFVLNNYNDINSKTTLEQVREKKNNYKNLELMPGGEPVGVKLNTKGVLVVALSDIEGNDNNIICPAAQAGVQIGDCILEINNQTTNSSEDTSKQINSCDGKELKLLIDRNGVKLEKTVVPVKNKNDDKYKIGLWVRDSTAGVGTLTFYDPKTNTFGALGHPITDVDTGTILKVSTGNITNSSIMSVKKGLKGTPGELRGIFVNEENPIGFITQNTICGIFGEGTKVMSNYVNKGLYKIATRDEIKEGPAKIITTIEGDKPEQFDIVIEKLLQQEAAGPKSMIIRVTDKKLLEKTGGIVQGMSGSPIIQNNKLVGAVTHVLVNNPDTGYGIYIEWMINEGNITDR